MMGNKSSKGDVTDHVAFSTSSGNVPNIVVTSPSPLISPESPKPFAPPPSPMDATYSYPYSQFEHPRTPHTSENDLEDLRETRIMAGTPPPDRPPPPPPVESQYDDIRESTYTAFPSVSEPPLPSVPPPVAAPRKEVPTITRNIVYAKDKLVEYEGLNTTDRKKENGYAGGTPYYSIKYAKPSELNSRFKPFAPTPLSGYSTVTTTASSRNDSIDGYPIYNPVSDYSFKSGTTFQQGTFPIDANRINIGFCGRQGAGKSTLINALRGISVGDPQSAGRNPCDNMEPFRFIEEKFQNIVLWEIPFPRTFSNVSAVYDKNMGFDRFYETHKLHLFNRLFVLIPDGGAQDVDIYFSRIVQSRRTPLTFLSTKSDDDLDVDARESGLSISQQLKKEYEEKARRVFNQSLQMRSQILCSIDLLFISSPVVRNIVSGTTGYLHYKMQEDELLDLVDLKAGCHYELESELRKQREESGALEKSLRYEVSRSEMQQRPSELRGLNQSTSKVFPPQQIQKSTVLVDAGFDILFGTDDRVFGNMKPSTSVRRTGKTAFNYGFIGNLGVGKSAMINAMRGMSSKHPLAAGKGRSKHGSCEKFEFDDDLLKYSVTLWELHYPKKINSFFEFIDRHNISGFTAIFVLIDGVPKDEDLAFSKIAHRRNASVIFLSSKSDKKLSAISRSDEIPICDLLKQRFVDKSLARFDRAVATSAPELCGRVHAFFVSAPVFRALRCGDDRMSRYILHERAVFDFLKQKRIIAELLESPADMKAGLYANVNTDTAGVNIVEEK